MSQTLVTLTNEQQAIITETLTNLNGVFAVNAVAGSG